jgi:hypothetical protein
VPDPGRGRRSDIGDRCACAALVICILVGVVLLARHVMAMQGFR